MWSRTLQRGFFTRGRDPQPARRVNHWQYAIYRQAIRKEQIRRAVNRKMRHIRSSQCGFPHNLHAADRPSGRAQAGENVGRIRPRFFFPFSCQFLAPITIKSFTHVVGRLFGGRLAECGIVPRYRRSQRLAICRNQVSTGPG